MADDNALLSRIVVPISRKGPSQRAVRTAIVLAIRYAVALVQKGGKDCELRFVNVVDRRKLDSDEVTSAKVEAMGLLDTAEMLAKKHGVKKVVKDLIVESECSVVEKLVELSKKASLFVMATHGRSGLSRLVIGSVCEDLLKATHCPVLTCRESQKEIEELPSFSKALVAVDGSGLSQNAIDVAGDLAKAANVNLTLMSVAFSMQDPLLEDGVVSNMDQRRHDEAIEFLNGALEKLKVRDITASAMEKDVDSGLVDTILEQSEKYDCLVVATHGRTGLARLIVGSITATLVRKATVPVLVVPPTDD